MAMIIKETECKIFESGDTETDIAYYWFDPNDPDSLGLLFLDLHEDKQTWPAALVNKYNIDYIWTDELIHHWCHNIRKCKDTTVTYEILLPEEEFLLLL